MDNEIKVAEEKAQSTIAKNSPDLSKVAPRTCRICTKKFIENGPHACQYHPESFSGETAQRWLPPGVTKGGAEIHYFYTCCGGKIDSPGCCWTPHLGFDDPEDFRQRQPGMGV